MKKVIRLTENDLHGIIRKSVNKILREGGRLLQEPADINSDTEGLRDSLMQYIKNPVDVVKDVDYEPSDDEIIGALDDLDLDTDFSDLMGGQYDESRRMRGRRLTEGRLRRIVKESVKKVLRENELDYVPSASDYEGIEDDDFELDNYNGFYNYDNNGDYVPEFDEYGYDPSIMRDVDPDEISPDDLSVDADIAGVTESRKRMKRIIMESINKVLKEGKRTNNKPYFNNYDGSSKAGKEDHVYQYNNKDKSSSAIKKHNDRAKGHRIDSGIGPSDKGRDKLAARERQVNKNKNASTRYIDHPDTIQGKLVDKQHGDEIKNIMSKY